jgi:hypothetical protein
MQPQGNILPDLAQRSCETSHLRGRSQSPVSSELSRMLPRSTTIPLLTSWRDTSQASHRFPHDSMHMIPCVHLNMATHANLRTRLAPIPPCLSSHHGVRHDLCICGFRDECESFLLSNGVQPYLSNHLADHSDHKHVCNLHHESQLDWTHIKSKFTIMQPKLIFLPEQFMI